MPQIPQQMRQEAQQQPNQLLQLLSSLLQTAPQQQAQMGVAQSDISANEQRMGGGGGQPQKPQANAYQKGVDKALNESGYAHASEALMKGSDPMMIANQSAQMGMQQQQQNVAPLLQSLLSMAQQPPQQSAQPMQQPKQQQYGNTSKGLLSKLTGMDLNPTNTGLQLDNQAKQQQLRGEQPLQQGDKEKLTYTFANEIQKELLKKGSPDALTPEASAKFNLIIDGDKAVKEVSKLLEDSPGVVWSAPSFLKSQKGRQFESYVKRMLGNKLRLESGAVIGDKEIDNEYKKYGIGKTDSKETIRRKLNPLYEFYQGSLNVADPTGTHRQRASGGQSQETTIGRFQVRYH